MKYSRVMLKQNCAIVVKSNVPHVNLLAEEWTLTRDAKEPHTLRALYCPKGDEKKYPFEVPWESVQFATPEAAS